MNSVMLRNVQIYCNYADNYYVRQADLYTTTGMYRAIVPSGASTGAYEVIVMRYDVINDMTYRAPVDHWLIV